MTPERRILVVDDHLSFAEALAIAIDAQVDLRCVAIADTAAAAIEATVRFRPDVVVVDLRLPDVPGPILAAKLRTMRPGMPVLLLTAYADAANVAAAARAGVCAFLRKECSVQDIIANLRTAGEGSLAIDAGTLGSMMHRPAVPPTPPVDVGGVRLTPREQEVLDLLAHAQDAQGISRRLGISIHTTRGYVKALLGKLEAHSQLEAVVRAKHLGLVVDTVVIPDAASMSGHELTGTGMKRHSAA